MFVMNLNKVNFRFAVSFEDFHEKQSKFDEHYVKYMIRLHYTKDGE